jgi:hypothetical protein
VFVGSVSHGSQERAAHRIGVAESAGRCDLLEPLGPLSLVPTRSRGAPFQEIVESSLPEFAHELALEIPDAHCSSVRQRLCGRIAMTLFRNPNLQL